MKFVRWFYKIISNEVIFEKIVIQTGFAYVSLLLLNEHMLVSVFAKLDRPIDKNA